MGLTSPGHGLESRLHGCQHGRDGLRLVLVVGQGHRNPSQAEPASPTMTQGRPESAVTPDMARNAVGGRVELLLDPESHRWVRGRRVLIYVAERPSSGSGAIVLGPRRTPR